MKYLNLVFDKSSPTNRELPEDSGYEVAIMGRSNVGKSSLINAISNRKKLARSSQKPGCTNYFNCYTIGDEKRLIDLPGYGYAKRSKNMQQHWDREFERYIESRQSLSAVVVVIDARHAPKLIDLDLMERLSIKKIPIHLVANKADQLTQKIKNERLKEFEGMCSSFENCTWQLSSTVRSMNIDKLITYIKAAVQCGTLK